MMFNIKEDDKYKSGVYCLRGLNDQIIYIGSTVNFLHRKYQHDSFYKKDHLPKLLKEYIDKNGIDNISMSLICLCDKKEMRVKEKEFIKKLNPPLNCHLQGRSSTRPLLQRFGSSGWKGQKHLDSSKQKISEAMKKKPVNMIGLNGETIKRFESIRAVEKEYGFKAHHISAVCKGKRITAYGYKWEYAEGQGE